ncbi:CBS domain-containing protein [Candidatus Marsarchaeota archaeon]|nr:CBS domain-containing protein [Candidatus Marsarchaeota archaeon]
MAIARDIMHRHVVGVSPTTIAAAARSLAESSEVSLMPVIENNRLTGIILSHDLVGMEADSYIATSVRQPIFAKEQDDVVEVSKIMVRNNVERLPVVKDGLSMICVGIITSTDIVRSLKNADDKRQ